MYSKKSQSELIENKDYNMVLLLPHNATKIIYFSKSFSIRFFLLVIKEYYVFLKVAANVWHICDGRAFILKCNLGKLILQPLKSRQTETNCTPIANVLLPAAKSLTNFHVSRKLQVYFCRPEINL